MIAALSFLWNYKAWVLAAVIAATALAYISYIKIDHNFMTAEVTAQKSRLEILERSNTVLTQNAAAVKKQDQQLQKLARSSERVVKMAAELPKETKEVLQDANITQINDCLVDYADSGVLPDRCDAVKAYLPQGAAPAPAQGGAKPS